MDPQLTDHLLQQLHGFIDQLIDEGLDPVVLMTTELRLAFKRFFEPTFPRLVALSYQEIPNDIEIENAGVIMAPDTTNAIPEKEEAGTETTN